MATRSPVVTPRSFSTLANLETSAWSWRYVYWRTSPGSPSHMTASLSPRVARWRSRQLCEALSFPPANHFTYGGFHSRIVFHFVSQSSCCAHDAQYASRPCNAFAQTAGSLMFACSLNSSVGGNERSSCSSASISFAMSADSMRSLRHRECVAGRVTRGDAGAPEASLLHRPIVLPVRPRWTSKVRAMSLLSAESVLPGQEECSSWPGRVLILMGRVLFLVGRSILPGRGER